ncbi:endolytic transglycosylase MltG [Terribacillus saccharophilus]|uniref:endolytic transglycosylase MltG n=1 Tax=Terribacillus saccharophilus TaxID=361277 RepID=UPI003981EA57
MKQVIQGFATALLLAGACMLAFHFTGTPKAEKTETASAAVETEKPSINEMKKELEENDFYVLSNQDYDKLKESQKKAPEKPEKEEPKTYTLKLESGMNSEDVASALEKADIIEDASAFRTYLDITEASESLQVGTYHVSSDMEYKDISKLMTK